MEQERIWLLMGRKVSGEATMEELRELEALLQKDPELRYKYAVLNSWPEPAYREEWEEKTNNALEKHLLKMGAVFPKAGLPVKKEGHNIRKIISVLSLLILILGGYCTYLLMSKKTTQETGGAMAVIFTRNGSRSKAQLPDGTEVWLNAGSRLTYNPDMNNLKNREVTLSGEAFFEVAGNAGRPFFIHTVKMDIRVLGTSFNVKAYAEDKTTEATLITGAVEVSLNDGVERSIKLIPNQKIILEHSNGVGLSKDNMVAGYRVEKIRNNRQDTMVKETAWCNNVLVFDNERFEDIAVKMERWYGIKIHFANRKLKDYRFTGTFKKESFPEILEALKVTSSFHCRIVSNEVFITQ